LRDAFRTLSAEDDYRRWYDPFWVRAEPYRLTVKPGESVALALWIRNFRPVRQIHRIELRAPPGLRVEPAVIEGDLAGEFRRAFPVRVTADADAAPGVRLIGLDTTLDGQRYGEWFDFVVGVSAPAGR
jgi:uncharacterized membrane protein